MVSGGALVAFLSLSAVKRTRHDELNCSSSTGSRISVSLTDGYLSLEQTAWGKGGVSMSADLG